MLRIFTLIALAMIAGMASATSPSRSPIRFSAEASPSSLSLSDPLNLRVTVANTGATPVCVFGDLNYLIVLRVFDQAGVEIHGPAHFETVPPPPRKASAWGAPGFLGH